MALALHSGERQVAADPKAIRRDHRARYEWAARHIPEGSRVVDLGCGVGYGSHLLAEAGMSVTGVDNEPEAIEFARRHYKHRDASFICGEAQKIGGAFDAAVCFEIIEHIEDPLPMLRDLANVSPILLASVPNELGYPFGLGVAFHHRHYTPAQFEDLLNKAGWIVTDWFGQKDQVSEVEAKIDRGRTIVVKARRAQIAAASSNDDQALDIPKPGVPERVVILGLGPSLEAYVDVVKRIGARKKFADEVWGINAVGDVIQCDRIFHMDDVRIQMIRAEAKPESNIANMLTWMCSHPGPIYTSRPHPDFPGLVAYPLVDVLNTVGVEYFNSTAAYAVAFAIHLGVKRISMFGCDFTYPNAHDAEKGRACVEFYLGMAKARGIEIGIVNVTSLMDACMPRRDRFYGYDTIDIEIERGPDGAMQVAMTPHDRRASAEEIEAKYDHSKHPSPLVAAR